MSRLTELEPVFVDYLPETIEEGKLYISKKYRNALHLCACGCKSEVYTPLSKMELPSMWELTESDGKVSLSPSIGNFQIPCKTHYFIRDNQVIWL